MVVPGCTGITSLAGRKQKTNFHQKRLVTTFCSFLQNTTSVKPEMAVDDEICSFAVRLDNTGVNGRSRSKFGVS